jgi:hypothetical protein
LNRDSGAAREQESQGKREKLHRCCIPSPNSRSSMPEFDFVQAGAA